MPKDIWDDDAAIRGLDGLTIEQLREKGISDEDAQQVLHVIGML